MPTSGLTRKFPSLNVKPEEEVSKNHREITVFKCVNVKMTNSSLLLFECSVQHHSVGGAFKQTGTAGRTVRHFWSVR